MKAAIGELTRRQEGKQAAAIAHHASADYHTRQAERERAEARRLEEEAAEYGLAIEHLKNAGPRP